MRAGKAALCALIVLGGLFALFVCVCNTLVMGGAEGYILTEEQAKNLGADCVLVLGAKVYEDGSLSPVLGDRVATGVRLYELGAGKKLLLSGDHGQIEYDEVNAMKQRALSLGVPEDDVFLDHAGFSTYESMVRLKEVFGGRSVVIVTQSYHLYRAVYLARRMGLEAYGVPSDLRRYYKQPYYELRELGARTKDVLYTLFWPAPRYLGDPIDLTGSGKATWD